MDQKKMDTKKLLKLAHMFMYKNLEENTKLATEFEDMAIDKEPYKKALEIYGQVLKIDPKNKEALEGKENAVIMLEPLYPQQSMMAPIPLEPVDLKPVEIKKPVWRTPWERKKAAIRSQEANLSYTVDIVQAVYRKFTNNCEKLLIEAADYAKMHSKEETWQNFSEKIKSEVPLSKIAYVGTNFNVTNFLERLRKIKSDK